MRTRRRIFCAALTILCLLIDTSVMPFTGLNMSYVPRLCLAAVALIGTVLGVTQGTIYGAISGVLLGITVYQPVSLTALLYTSAGLVSGFLSHRVRKSMVTLIPAATAFTLYELIMVMYIYFTTTNFPSGKLVYALVRIIGELFVIQLLYIPAVRILKPDSARGFRRR